MFTSCLADPDPLPGKNQVRPSASDYMFFSFSWWSYQCLPRDQGSSTPESVVQLNEATLALHFGETCLLRCASAVVTAVVTARETRTEPRKRGEQLHLC